MKPRPKSQKKQGQIVLLMGLMATTFVIMFGLVVSIGHLVQAKINLQNAVDLAAMSGASYQARYLDHLSQVNYRFRQNFKWVLFDLYYTQSRFNQGLMDAVRVPSGPYTLMPSTFRNITFAICQQAYGYVPYTTAGELAGKRLKDNFDLCQNVTGTGVGRFIPRFTPSPIFVPDPRIIITNLAIAKLAAEAADIFRVGTDNNARYFHYVIAALRDRQGFQQQQFKRVIGQMQQAFGDGPGPLSEAYPGDGVMLQTFRDNLINANQNAEVSYMNSKETLAVSESDFEQATVNFNFLAIQFNSRSAGFETRPTTVSEIGVPGGYSRKRQSNESLPQNPSMVVLKATARPKLLFWPRELTPTISAVAVARPFGSKIGPPRAFFIDENPNTSGRDLANMALYVGDIWANAGGDIPGVGHVQFARQVLNLLPRGLGSGRNELRPDAGGGCPNSYGCMARSPTQYEGIMFNTYVPQAGPQFELAMPGMGYSALTGGDGYVLKDRPGMLTGLHNMEFAGIAPYYATPVSALTSWAPPAAIDDPTSRRIGYSIKLLSMVEACKELGLWGGGASSGGSELSFFCQPENAVLH